MIKIKIHPLTYLLMLSVLLCGYFNYFVIISIILIVHDIGHLITMKTFNIDIYDITILPFGSLINAKIEYNLNSNKIFLISIAGILIQILLYPLSYLLYQAGLVNDINLNIFYFYNKIIIIFNLIPIIPLDGSKILLSILERFLPYKLSLKVQNIVSVIFIIMLTMNSELSLNIILITLFLLFKTYESILNHQFVFYKFLLERYLYRVNYQKIKYINDIKRMFKNRHNYLNNEREDKYLAKIFANN